MDSDIMKQTKIKCKKFSPVPLKLTSKPIKKVHEKFKVPKKISQLRKYTLKPILFF